MAAEKRWKIQELSTNGWTSIDPTTDSLTKEDCDAQLNAYMDDGIAPNRLRAVPSQTRDEGLPQIDR
jgi:hypothetical protein|tara:strand:+ start:544 stop:744 length:201 start_codon:yes stop_codon:yes gene_type:complete